MSVLLDLSQGDREGVVRQNVHDLRELHLLQLPIRSCLFYVSEIRFSTILLPFKHFWSVTYESIHPTCTQYYHTLIHLHRRLQNCLRVGPGCSCSSGIMKVLFRCINNETTFCSVSAYMSWVIVFHNSCTVFSMTILRVVSVFPSKSQITNYLHIYYSYSLFQNS